MSRLYRLADHMGPSDVLWRVTERQVLFQVCPGGKWHISAGTPYDLQYHINAGRLVPVE